MPGKVLHLTYIYEASHYCAQAVINVMMYLHA